MTFPDDIAFGFVPSQPNANRYENISEDPSDVAMLIAGCLRRNTRVLDIGCGTGSTAFVYQKHSGCVVFGVEPDPDRAATARSRGLEVITGFYSEEIAKKQGPFDAIVFADVIEHIGNGANLLAEARKALKPDGVIIVSLPNIAHLTMRFNLLFGKFNYEPTGIMDATHLRWFTLASAQKWFRNLGFDVTHAGSTTNATLPAYYRRPWKYAPLRVRRALLRPGVKMLPGLFGCQHIFVLKSPVAL